MSKDLQNKNSEEIDLGQVFNAIGRLFERFFKLIGSFFFKAIFSLIIFALKLILDKILIVGIVVGIAFILGFISDKYRHPVYEANMLVKPYFDSKYQLLSSIDYFNSLLDEGSYEVLADIFKMSDDEAKSLVDFNVESGPETKNELLKQYDTYLKSLDSTRAKSVTYNDFVENRDIYSSELYMVGVKSKDSRIFRKLEPSFDSIFSNEYAVDQRNKRDEILNVKKATFEKVLQNMDTLRTVYLSVIQKEAERGNSNVTVQGMLPLQQEKSQTKEYEVLMNEIRIRDSIKTLEQLKVEENSYYEILSRFPESGRKVNELYTKHWFLFPVMAFIGLCIIYIISSTVRFIRSYE